MFAVINQLSIKPEFLEQVEAAFLENVGGIESLPGFKGFRFLKSLNPAEVPCVVEVIWEDEAAFGNWKRSEHFQKSHAGMGAFRDAFYGPPKFSRYSVSRSI